MDRLPASYLLVTTDYYSLLSGKSRTGQVTTTSKLLTRVHRAPVTFERLVFFAW